jgi:hypothetical protein
MVNREGQRLPDFIGVGAIRTGSTWLHLQLKRGVGLPLVKETHFFSQRYDKGMSWYARQFRDASQGALLGEFCPTYFPVVAAVERIRHDLPYCKIIVTLRDPVERAYSHYKMLVHDGYASNVPMAEAIQRVPNIVGSSRYATHLKRWFDSFGRDRVLVTLYDDLMADEQGYLDRICDFVGQPRVTVVPLDDRAINSFELAPKNKILRRVALGVRENLQNYDYARLDTFLDRIGFYWFCRGRGEKFMAMPAELSVRLREELLPEIETLEQMISRDLSGWKSPRNKPAAVRAPVGGEVRAV